MKGFFPYFNASFGGRFDPFNPGTDGQGFAMSVSLIADQGFPPNNRKQYNHIRPQLTGGVSAGIGFSDPASVSAAADLGVRFYSNRRPSNISEIGFFRERFGIESVRVMGSAGYAGPLDNGLGDLPLVVGGAVHLIHPRSYSVGNPVSAALKLGEVGVTARFLTTLPESDEHISMVDLSLTFGRLLY